MVTEDGYVLTLGHIAGKINEPTAHKPAVLFMHAQDCDMNEYVAHGPETAPAFVLVNEGYDVWLGNNRGSLYSHAHVSLDIHSKEYWDFYQEDMARYDAPAFIDYITETTGHEKISYVGHSEGTTQFFLGASLLPEYYTSKINLFMALAPVASTANIPTPYLRFAAKFIKEIELAVMKLGLYNWFAPMQDAIEGEELFCSIPELKEVCKHGYSLLHNEGVDDPKVGETFLSHEPSGQSWRTFAYYAQMINSGNFELYDYGHYRNSEIYGQKTPPLVPIQNYNVPTALFSGSLDNLADPVDVAWITEQISDSVVFAKEYLMDHFTFVIGKDMSYFTVDAVNVIKQYNPPLALI